jgi:hypothetical protein
MTTVLAYIYSRKITFCMDFMALICVMEDLTDAIQERKSIKI